MLEMVCLPEINSGHGFWDGIAEVGCGTGTGLILRICGVLLYVYNCWTCVLCPWHVNLP